MTSMEEMECKDLQNFASELESADARERAVALVAFGKKAMTGVAGHLETALRNLEDGKVPKAVAGAENERVVERLARVVLSGGTTLSLADFLSEMASLPGATLHREELFREAFRCLCEHAENPETPLSEVVWNSRNRLRQSGRRSSNRIVSRTLLVKGLEFDHTLILDPSELDAKNLFVAMTRGARSLTVLGAADDRIQYEGSGS